MTSVPTPRALAPRAALLALAAAGACADPTAFRQDDLPLAPNSGPSFAKGATAAQPGAPGQYVVLFKDGASAPGVAALSASGAVQRGRLRYVNGAVYDRVADPAALAADPNVEAVVENVLSYPTAFSYQKNATFERRGWQWSMHQIRADSVPAGVTGNNVRACIIDSGVDETHQDLRGKVVARESFVTVANGFPVSSLNAALDSNGHGSHVASTVTSNGIGVAGVAPGVRIMNARVFAATGGTPLAAIFDAMAWCRTNGADVVNMSLGGTATKPFSPATEEVRAAYAQQVADLREAGAAVIVAAGNENSWLDPAAPFEIWPAQIPGTVAVASTAPGNPFFNFPFNPRPPHAGFDGKSVYTNLGSSVTLFAPGGTVFVDRIQSQIISACSSIRPGCEGGKLYRAISGTSMATPHAVGVAALITGRTAAPKGLARTQAVEACLAGTGDVITVSGVVRNHPSLDLGAAPQSATRPRINARRAAIASCAGI